MRAVTTPLPNDDKKRRTSMIMSSGVTMDQVYQEIKKIRQDMVKREDLEALVDTVEILSSPASMQAIKKSDRDIRQGRTKTISSVDDLLDECA
jgi:hypothetical protein